MLTFDLNSKNHIPLYEQLYKYIKNELETGKISAGEKLPSKRELASHLKISIVTVETAYAQLAAEGYITPRPGSGFYAESVQVGGIWNAEKESIYIPEKKPKKTYKYMVVAVLNVKMVILIGIVDFSVFHMGETFKGNFK